MTASYWAQIKAADARRDQLARDEDEAYARNYAMDRQAERIAELTEGPGPGYEQPHELTDAEADEISDYLSWRDDESWGDERGNPPDCLLRDGRIETETERWPEPAEKDTVTEMPRSGDGSWTFEDWASSRGYSADDIELADRIEEDRAAQREGAEITRQILAYADDSQYADVRDQIEGMAGYVRRVTGLCDREPGQL